MHTLSPEELLAHKRRLARLLVEKSYREGDFVLASGRRSDYYFDCRVTALHAEGSWLIGTLFNHLLGQMDITGVGGMAQVYADSSGHTDRGTKTLLLRFDGKNWRIAREEWAPAVAAAPAGQAQP